MVIRGKGPLEAVPSHSLSCTSIHRDGSGSLVAMPVLLNSVLKVEGTSSMSSGYRELIGKLVSPEQGDP